MIVSNDVIIRYALFAYTYVHTFTHHVRAPQIANLGGVFNLCMGISLMSLLELVYYVAIRLRDNYMRSARCRRRISANDRMGDDDEDVRVVQVLQLAESNAKWRHTVQNKMVTRGSSE